MNENEKDAVKNEAIPVEERHEETEIQYGSCVFCGQMFQLETMLGVTSDEELDRAATMKCDCPQATNFQRVENAKDHAEKAIAEMFGEDEEKAGKMLMDAIPMIINGEIEKLSVTSITGCQAQMKMTNKGKLKIERNEKLRRAREL